MLRYIVDVYVMDRIENAGSDNEGFRIGDRIKFANCLKCLIYSGGFLNFWVELSSRFDKSVYVLAYLFDTREIIFRQQFLEKELAPKSQSNSWQLTTC